MASSSQAGEASCSCKGPGGKYCRLGESCGVHCISAIVALKQKQTLQKRMGVAVFKQNFIYKNR